MKRISYFISGFTLIELMVVIGIIGILSGIFIETVPGIRQRARDSQRKSDLRQIQSSLELIRADIGSYPTTMVQCGNSLTAGSPAITYMQKVPCDPLTNDNYIYGSDATTYSLATCLENVNDSQKDITNNTMYCPVAGGKTSYTLQSQ